MFFNIEIDIFAIWKVNNFNYAVVFVHIQPLWNWTGTVCFHDSFEFFRRFAAFCQSNNIASLQKDGWNVCFVAVNGEMTVTNQLSCFSSGRSHASSVNDIVDTAFQDSQEVFTSHALLFGSHFEIFSELTFKNTIEASCFLFCTELQSVLGNFLAVLTVLARSIASAGQSAFVRVASFAFEEQFLSFTTAKLANRTCISCHILVPP